MSECIIFLWAYSAWNKLFFYSIKPLTLLINQVLNSVIFPDKLKIAKVTPIFKKGDPSLFENYRPISLLPAISKVLEKIIALQLSSYFEKNKLLFDNPYGFRLNNCTEHAALELTYSIIKKLDINDIPLKFFSIFRKRLTLLTIQYY